MGFNRAKVQDYLGLFRGSRAGDGFIANPAIFHDSTDAAGTISAAEMAFGVYRRTGLSVGRTDTTDTAANILAADAFKGMDIGDSYVFQIVNHSGQTLTIAGGAGVTIVGPTTLATNTSRLAILVRTAAATFDLVLT